MRSFLLFILILASKPIYACLVYPDDGDSRISFFNPYVYGYYYAYSDFYYSPHYFGTFKPNDPPFPADYVEPNTKLWFNYCKGNVDAQSIQEAVYQLYGASIADTSQNAMICYLYEQKDDDALDYLRFAKGCEYYNSWHNDPWEKGEKPDSARVEIIDQAVKLAEKVKHPELKRRYAFLGIRMACYGHDYGRAKKIFASAFGKTKNKDILYYWSLYFKALSERDDALANFQLAQVFAHAADKRLPAYRNFNRKTPIEQILKFAKTGEEKANVYLLAGMGKYDKALPFLQKMYEHSPASETLSFMLLREINKIEDYVFTPYYTVFKPKFPHNHWWEQDDYVQDIFDRSERDRAYAKSVLNFVKSVDLRKVENPFFWQCCKAYLQFITRDYKSCLALVGQLEKSATGNAFADRLPIIKALAMVAKQPYGKAVIPAEAQSIIMANREYSKFIFAIGKELEHLGNFSDAALMYSKLNQSIDWDEPDYSKGLLVYWRLKKGKQNYGHHFTDYFEYIDVTYTPEQLQTLIDEVQKNKGLTDSFSVFKNEKMSRQIPLLYDLLGTKYIRQNKLENALAAYEKAGNLYWSRAYTLWENEGNIFDHDPFVTLKYTPQFIALTDTVRLNKYAITKRLIHYLQKAEDKNEKDRDYYYFLVANAYYNMGREGNIWMMRRLGGWSRYNLSGIEDEAEFRQSNLAKKYYLLAKQYAMTDKFKALCLRMVIRCERNKIAYSYIDGVDYFDRDENPMVANKYYLELKQNYGEYFNDLTSNCDSFEEYFEARR